MNNEINQLFETTYLGAPATNAFNTFYALLPWTVLYEHILNEIQRIDVDEQEAYGQFPLESPWDIHNIFDRLNEIAKDPEGTDYILLTADNTLADDEPAVCPATPDWVEELMLFTDDDDELAFLKQLKQTLVNLTTEPDHAKHMKAVLAQKKVVFRAVTKQKLSVLADYLCFKLDLNITSSEKAIRQLYGKLASLCDRWEVPYKDEYQQAGVTSDHCPTNLATFKQVATAIIKHA